MLNKIWPIFIMVSIIYSIISGNVENLNNGIFSATENAIQLCITFLGTICLWNGIMNIAFKTKIVKKLSKLLSPIIKLIFPEIKNNEKIKEEISMNMMANILGLGNAATPLGLKAMQSMQEINNKKDELSNSMMMFIVINTASLQLIPTTIIAIRTSLNSNNPCEVVFPVWCASICSIITAIIITKILIKRKG